MGSQRVGGDRHVVWVDGEIHRFDDRGGLPDDLSVLLGRVLGMSPVVYLPADTSAAYRDVALDVLVRAAGLLGYAGLTRDVVVSAVESVIDGVTGRPVAGSDITVHIPYLVSLVPSPTSHKALPPGTDWFVHVEPWEPAEVTDGCASTVRTVVGRHRRNHHNQAASILLWDDCELQVGAVDAQAEGFDEMIWLNTDNRVACAGQAAVVLSGSGLQGGPGSQAVTPPLSDGAVDTPARRLALSAGVMIEQSLDLEQLLDPDATVSLLTAWGDSLQVESISDRTSSGEQTPE